MAYNKAQWLSSFEDQLSLLRPHLTPRVLATMALAAWARHGQTDPIAAAREVSRALDPPAAPERRGAKPG